MAPEPSYIFMQISSSHNLPITTGYTPGDARRSPSPQQAIAQAQQTAAASPEVQLINRQAPIPPVKQAQPLFDQSFTHRGEQARRAYESTETGGEMELMHRLDVRV